MATLTAGDKTNLREKKHSSKFYLSALQPTTLLSARVNNASIARGDRSIAYDTGSGDFASIEAGQTLWVGTTAGDNDVGKIRVKSISGTATSGTITIDENGIDWGDNLHLTILHNYEIWAILPRIDSGIFYKFYDTTYSNQNSQPNPIAIAGSHQAGFLSGGSLILNVPVASSYAVASGATISSKVVTVSPSAGASVGAESGGVIPITYTTAGDRWVKTVVTDSNGKTQTTRRVHFVKDANNLPYQDFSVSSVGGDFNSGGWSFDVEVHGDAELSDFPDGTLVLLWREGRIDDTEGYVNVLDTGDNIVCCGYIRRDNATDNLQDGSGSVSFSVDTPNGIMSNRSEMGPISIEAVTSPAFWYQYASWLTVGRAVHHHLKWHSTVLETCDVIGLLDNTLGMEVAEFSENSLLARVNGLAFGRGIFAKLVSDRLGRLHLAEDIQMFNETDRGAEDTIFSIVQQDLGGEVNIAREPEKRTALAFVDGFSFNGTTATAFVSIAGGYIDGSAVSIQVPEPEGSGSANKPKQVFNNQTDSNERCGRVLAASNNPLKEVRFPLRADYLGAFDIVPSLGWYGWSVANATLKRNLALNGKSLLCRRVQNRLDGSNGTIETDVVLEAEAFGPDGIPGNYPTSYPTPTLPEPNWTLPADPLVGCSTGLTPQTIEIFETAVSSTIRCVKLTDTQHLVIWDDSTSSLGKACVLDISGSTTAAGTPHTFESAGSIFSPALVALDSTNALVIFQDQTGADWYAIVLQVSGSTVTSDGTRQLIEAQQGNESALAVLSATKALAFYNRTGVGDNKGVVLDISGTAITVNATQTILSGGPTGKEMDAVALSASTVLLVYEENTTIKGRIYSSITTTFTENSPTTLRTKSALLYSSYKSLALVNSTTYVVVYEDSDPNPDELNVFAGTWSGTTVSTPGSDVQLAATNNSIFGDITEVGDDETVILGYWENTGSAAGQANCASVSGTTITLGSGGFAAVTPTAVTNFGQMFMTPVNNSKVMLAFEDDSDSDKGKARIIELDG